MSTLEANIFAKINAVVNVSITKLVTVVTNSAGSIGADSAARCQASNAASAEQTALYQTLASGGTTIFGTSFGSVLVSNITQGIATNPSKTAFHFACTFSWCVLPDDMFVKDNALSAMLLGTLRCINVAH
jgi:hypothetical protein